MQTRTTDQTRATAKIAAQIAAQIAVRLQELATYRAGTARAVTLAPAPFPMD